MKKKIMTIVALVSFVFVTSIQVVNADGLKFDETFGGALGGVNYSTTSNNSNYTSGSSTSYSNNGTTLVGDNGSGGGNSFGGGSSNGGSGCSKYGYCGPSSYGLSVKVVRYGQTTNMQEVQVGLPILYYDSGFFINSQEITYVSAASAPINGAHNIGQMLVQGLTNLLGNFESAWRTDSCSPTAIGFNPHYTMSSATFTSNVNRNGNTITIGGQSITFKDIIELSQDETMTRVCTSEKVGNIVSDSSYSSTIDKLNKQNDAYNNNDANNHGGQPTLKASICQHIVQIPIYGSNGKPTGKTNTKTVTSNCSKCLYPDGTEAELSVCTGQKGNNGYEKDGIIYKCNINNLNTGCKTQYENVWKDNSLTNFEKISKSTDICDNCNRNSDSSGSPKLEATGDLYSTKCEIVDIKAISGMSGVATNIVVNKIAKRNPNKTIKENIEDAFDIKIKEDFFSEYYIVVELIRVYGKNGHSTGIIGDVAQAEGLMSSSNWATRTNTKYTCNTYDSVKYVYEGDTYNGAPNASDCPTTYYHSSTASSSYESDTDATRSGSCSASYKQTKISCSKGTDDEKYTCYEYGCSSTTGVWTATTFSECKGVQFTYTKILDNDHGAGNIVAEYSKTTGVSSMPTNFSANIYNIMNSAIQSDKENGYNNRDGQGNFFLGPDTNLALVSTTPNAPHDFVDLANPYKDLSRVNFGVGYFWPIGFIRGCQEVCSNYLNGKTIEEYTDYSSVPKEYIGCAENYCENLVRGNDTTPNDEIQSDKLLCMTGSAGRYDCHIPYPSTKNDEGSLCIEEKNDTECSNTYDLSKKQKSISSWSYAETVGPGKFDRDTSTFLLVNCKETSDVTFSNTRQKKLTIGGSFPYTMTVEGEKKCEIDFDTERFEFIYNTIPRYLTTKNDKTGQTVYVRKLMEDLVASYNSLLDGEKKFERLGETLSTLAGKDPAPSTSLQGIKNNNLKYIFGDNQIKSSDSTNPKSIFEFPKVEISELTIKSETIKKSTGDEYKLEKTGENIIYDKESDRLSGKTIYNNKSPVVHGRLLNIGCSDYSSCGCNYSNVFASNCFIDRSNWTFFYGDRNLFVNKYTTQSKSDLKFELVETNDSTERLYKTISDKQLVKNTANSEVYACFKVETEANILVESNKENIPGDNSNIKLDLCDPTIYHDKCVTTIISENISIITNTDSITKNKECSLDPHCDVTINGIKYDPNNVLTFDVGTTVTFGIVGNPNSTDNFDIKEEASNLKIMPKKNTIFSLSDDTNNKELKYTISESDLNNKEIYIAGAIKYKTIDKSIIKESKEANCTAMIKVGKSTDLECKTVLKDYEMTDREIISEKYCEHFDPKDPEKKIIDSRYSGNLIECTDACYKQCPIACSNDDAGLKAINDYCEQYAKNYNNKDAKANCIQDCVRPCTSETTFIYRPIHNNDPFPDNKYDNKLGEREIGLNWIGKEHYITADDDDLTSVTGKHANEMVEYVIDLTPGDIRSIRKNTNGGENGQKIRYLDDNNIYAGDDSKVYTSPFIRIDDRNSGNYSSLFNKSSDINGVSIAPFKEVVKE